MGVDLGRLLQTCGSFVYILILISLNGLFIYKLVNVYKRNKESNSSGKKWLYVITKISILCFLSTWCTLLFITMSAFRDSTTSPYYYFVMRLCMIADTYANFSSLLLSFSYFDAWYNTMCGLCDAKCHSIWHRCVHASDDQEAMSWKGTRTLETGSTAQRP